MTPAAAPVAGVCAVIGAVCPFGGGALVTARDGKCTAAENGDTASTNRKRGESMSMVYSRGRAKESV